MFKMGCAKADVTPSWKTYIRGYASRNRLTDEIEEPIEVGVIALEQDGVKSLIITCDMVGIEFTDSQKIYKAVYERTGINYPNIFLSSSHTHFAPAFTGYIIYTNGGELPLGEKPADEKYYAFWLDKMLAAAEHAIADMEEVELLQADIPVSSVAFNRRTVQKSDGMVKTNYTYPDNADDYNFSDIDTTLHVWKFMSGTHPKAVLARYGCHPVTGGRNGYGISADYPGYFKQAVQEKLGCPGFFMLGTAGDVVPIQRHKNARKDIGEVLASSIRLAERTFRKTTDFEIKTANAMLKVNAPALVGKSAEDVDKIWRDALDAAKNSSDYNNKFYMAGMLLATYQDYKSSETVLPIQLMQLGDRTLVGLPFEVLTIIGKKIREVFPDAAVVSCTGGYEGYLPMKEDFPKGGYEATGGTILAEDTGDNIVATAIAALKEFGK